MSELFRRGFPHHGITKTELSVAAYVFAGLTVLAFSRIAWLSRQEGMAWSSIAVTPALIAGAATTQLLLNGWLGWTLFSIILFFTVSTWTVGWTEAIPSRFSYVSKVYIKPEGFDLALRNADYVHVPWSATRSISTEGKFISVELNQRLPSPLDYHHFGEKPSVIEAIKRYRGSLAEPYSAASRPGLHAVPGSPGRDDDRRRKIR